ncbi:LysR family transcriptional regulator [Opitutaceae bacterium]
MELRHLRYFVAVAETLSYRRAAERLHVSQPALSKQIKDLEHAVGVQLLDRDTGGVRLTDAGAVFLDEARDILERVDMAVVASQEAASGQGGRITVGNLGAISASFLPATLSAFRARYPRVEVNLQEISWSDQISALKAGRTQIGFLAETGVPLPPEFDSTEVLESRIALALGRDHRLARKSRVSLAELADEQFLCIGESERHDLHRRRMEAVFKRRGIRHRPFRRVNSFESLTALIAGDHGISLLLPFALTRGIDTIVFRRISEDGDDLDVRIQAVWCKSEGPSLAKNFVQVLLGLRAKDGAGAAGARPHLT